MKFLHHLLKGASLTGALFVFQACYGMPQTELDMARISIAPMSFSLVSRTTGRPLEGIRIKGSASVWEKDHQEQDLLGITDADGRCRVEIPYKKNYEGPFLTFEDADGQFVVKDTTLADLRDRDIVIKLDSVQ